jgi:hypothetical protein
MANEILSYLEMCQREGSSLQRGMNFGMGGWYSVVLMSVRENAPLPASVERALSAFWHVGTGNQNFGAVCAMLHVTRQARRFGCCLTSATPLWSADSRIHKI